MGNFSWLESSSGCRSVSFGSTWHDRSEHLFSSLILVNGSVGILPSRSCSKYFHELRNLVLPADFLLC